MVVIFTEVAFSTTQVSVELCPKSMVAGFAAKLTIRGRLPANSMTVAAVAVCVLAWRLACTWWLRQGNSLRACQSQGAY
jgi:hypothetical protein